MKLAASLILVGNPLDINFQRKFLIFGGMSMSHIHLTSVPLHTLWSCIHSKAELVEYHPFLLGSQKSLSDTPLAGIFTLTISSTLS